MSRFKVTVDLTLTAASQFGYKLAGFAVLTLLARGLSQDELGFLLFTLATCELMALGTELGSSAWLMREVAVARERPLSLLGEVLGFRIALLVVYLALAAAAAAVLAPGQLLTFMACAGYAGLKDLHRSFAALFNGSRRIVLGIVSFGAHLVTLIACVWLAVSLHPGAGSVAAAYLGAGLVLSLLSLALVVGHYGHVQPVWLPAVWRRVVASSVPLFGLGILTMIQLRVDVALLGMLRSYADVATYEASARLFEASQAIVRPLTMVFLPIAAGLAANGSYAALRRSLLRLSALALAVGVTAALLVLAVADQVVLTIYGATYAASGDVLRAHFAATPFVFVGAVALFHVTALRRERAALSCAAAGLGLNLLLDLLLIPDHGAAGAAWATVAAEAATAMAMLALAWSSLRKAGVATRRPPLVAVVEGP